MEARLEQALTRAGRQRKEITIVAVTKLFPAAVFQQAYSLGLHHFGENYVQEFESKYSHVSSLQHARFHFIGHLQSNKARRATEIFHVLQTIDTPKLARRLNEAG
ncbi:MAG: YggS family pyridoxal phosphate-dependent enzyme, partial [Acidobacteria bacterium]|nr:YggS family pyridoxal phosphate-dependent enzyme [Acidobacteriota bacterium]